MNAWLLKIFSVIMTFLMTVFPSIFGAKTNVEGFEVDGSSLVITLDSNATTGCSWALDNSAPTVIKLDKTYYVADSNPQQLLGKGGRDVFEFTALSEGEATLRFTYGQQWEGGSMFSSQVFYCTVDADLNVDVFVLE